MKMQISDPLQLVFPADLAVHNPVPVIVPRMLLQCRLDGIEYLIQAPVPDRMDRHRHAVRIRHGNHLLQGFRCIQGKAAGPRIVGIGSGKMGRPAAQRAVTKELDRADPEDVRARGGPKTLIEKRFQAGRACELRLFIHAHGHLAVFFHLLIDIPDHLPRDALEHLKIVRLNAGDPVAIHSAACSAQHLPDLLASRNRQRLLRDLHGIVIEPAVRSSILHSDRPALRGNRRAVNPGKSERL